MDEYRVRLPVFDGPLDLLLYLVKKNEVDVCDIPVAVIADQFRAYLSMLRTIDVELAGELRGRLRDCSTAPKSYSASCSGVPINA